MPELSFSLDIVIIFVGGILLLRISGKKSIAQLTIPEAVIFISIGTLLIQPLSPKSEWAALYGGAIMVVGLIISDYLQIWIGGIRKIITGSPTIVIQNGKVDFHQLKKERMNIDQLEMRLRQLQISQISDVQVGTIEASGELSVNLVEGKKNTQKEDIELVLTEIRRLRDELEEVQRSLNKKTPHK